MGRRLDTDDEADAFVERQDGWALARAGVPAIMVGGSFSNMELLNAFLVGPYHGPTTRSTAGLMLDGAAEDANLLVALGRRLADPADYQRPTQARRNERGTRQMDIPLGLTFDDVLLQPAESSVLPSQADTTHPGDARDRAQHPDPLLGDGHGHRGRHGDRDGAAGRARRPPPQHGRSTSRPPRCAAVKRFESGMVVNPITMTPDQTLADALELMARHKISGIPVTEKDGRLVGILTNRDVRFAENPRQPVSELMTRDNLVTVGPGVTQEEARRQLHQRRIEKLLVVDDDQRCIGLITVKDIEKAVTYPDATKDGTGRLRVAAATTVGDKGFERSRGADRRRMRPDRDRHRARPQSRRRRRGRADASAAPTRSRSSPATSPPPRRPRR